MKTLEAIKNYIASSSNLMATLFFIEITLFVISGFNLAMKFYKDSLAVFVCGLFIAFVLGDAIRIREREGYKG